jgi:high-affinity nickel-transport protein
MLAVWVRPFSDRFVELRVRLVALYTFLVVANLGIWAGAVFAFRPHPLILGTALLAYTFGLRHAVDADHIAAIDNVTRKLMQEGKRPVSVGFWFSLGHSAVVVLAALAIAVTTTVLATRIDVWKGVGGTVSTSVSMLFLFTVAAMNTVILAGVWKTFHHVRRGGAFADCDFDLLLSNRGLLARLFRPVFRLVTRSWHMFPLGFLFGLGFDTATEVALLGLSASQASEGMSISSLMIFPALFAAGMCLIDTTDGVLMLGAYNWAYVRPMRKLYYNLVITAVSVVVALLIGGIEGLGLITNRLGLEGWPWKVIVALNGNFNGLGFAIIGVFVFAWVTSLVIYRYARVDQGDAAPRNRNPFVRSARRP